MGLSFSCPIGNLDDLDNHLESILSKSLSFKENDVKRSISFDDHRYSNPNKMIRGSLSFNGRELDRVSSLKCSSAKQYYRAPKETLESPSLERKISGFEPLEPEPKPRGPESPLTKPVMNRDVAAVKLQKTYKSFRTRRQLADCAVLAEQRWWKLLDFAVLKCTSVSFFEDDKPETAVARWSRARTRAAKVGKGLSKNEKARKLALQHWLEAIDPRHRYGHNLQFYYAKWLHCQSRQPFFYWLDVGEGKEVNLERCSRQKLQQQCIKYLGPIEREAYEVTVEDGKFMYTMSKNLIDTRNGPDDAKWIFVLSTSMVLYVGMKQKGKFQHSSFLAGGATLSAGRLVIIDGILKAVWPHSGHYLPTEENFDAFISFLEQHHVDLDAVKKSPDGEDEFSTEMPGFGLRNSVSEPEIFQNTKKHAFKKTKQGDLKSNITTLEIPKNKNIISAFQNKASEPEPDPDSASDYDTAEEFLSDFDTAEEFLSNCEFMVSKRNLFDYGEEDEAYDESVPHEKILQRINSHKETKSFQLGKQLSFKWTTGAGPRIGCVRDYPLEIQVCAMEEACLSPKGSFMSPRKFGGEMSGQMKKKVEKSPLFSEI